jgi:hypothetical protein
MGTTKSLSSWSLKFIGSIKMQILLATRVILCLDVAMDSRLLTPEECALCHLLKKKLMGLHLLSRLWRSNGCVSFGFGRVTLVLVSSTHMPAIGDVGTSLVTF